MIPGLVRLVTGVRARWQGVAPVLGDPAARRIYFANHSSHLDALVIWASLPAALRRTTRPVAALDYWGGTALRRRVAGGVFNAVLIDRARVTAHHNPLPVLQAALDGASLIMFPEGSRQAPDGPMGDFKSGLWRLARDNPRVELVPVYLDNLNRVLPRGDFIPVPLLATVTFGGPLAVGDGEDKHAFLARAQQAILTLRAGARGGVE